MFSLGEAVMNRCYRFQTKKAISLAARAYFLDAEDNAFSITIMATSDNRLFSSKFDDSSGIEFYPYTI